MLVQVQLLSTQLLGDNSPESVACLNTLQAEALTILSFRLYFKGYVYSKQPWKNVSLQRKEQTCLLLIKKDTVHLKIYIFVPMYGEKY